MNNIPNRPPPAYTSEDNLTSRDVEACLCSSQRNDMDQIQPQARPQTQSQARIPATRQSVSATAQMTHATNATTRNTFLRGVVSETESTYRRKNWEACILFTSFIAVVFIVISLFWIGNPF